LCHPKTTAFAIRNFPRSVRVLLIELIQGFFCSLQVFPWLPGVFRLQIFFPSNVVLGIPFVLPDFQHLSDLIEIHTVDHVWQQRWCDLLVFSLQTKEHGVEDGVNLNL
jgi:hypothetical protein